MSTSGNAHRRRAAALLAGILFALASSGPANAQPIGDEPLFVWGISAHAAWEFSERTHVTRYAAYAVEYVSDAYPGEVHTDVGVMRRRCSVRVFKAGTCQFRPKDGVDENVELAWDPSLSEVRLTFTYRNHDHAVTWVGRGDHSVEPDAHVPPGFVGVSSYVARDADAFATIYGDRVSRKGVVPEETYMWQGGFLWKWIS